MSGKCPHLICMSAFTLMSAEISNSQNTISVSPGQSVNLGVNCRPGSGCTISAGHQSAGRQPSNQLGLCYESLLTTDEKCGKPASMELVTMEQCCSTVLKKSRNLAKNYPLRKLTKSVKMPLRNVLISTEIRMSLTDI